jgi:hypothetical protein
MPKRPLDITIFAILFFISAFIELGNIMYTGWKYQPKVFGLITHGLAAKVVLASHPLLHVILGYGFLKQSRWAFYLALFYAADVLTSTISSYILEGYGFIRTIFLVALPPFVIYLMARRNYFVG